MLGDIIILQMCTINDNHMLYGPRDVEHDGQDFLSLWAIFCPFITLSPLPPQKTQKIKILKKKKKTPGDITILHKCSKNHDHVLHCSWDTMCDGCNSYFLFWAIFCPFTPLTTQKLKRRCNDHMMYDSWNILCKVWMDTQTNGQVEKARYNHCHKPMVQKTNKNKQLVCSQPLTNPQSLYSLTCILPF